MFRTWTASLNFSVINLVKVFISLSTISRLKKILIGFKSSHQVSFWWKDSKLGRDWLFSNSVWISFFQGTGEEGIEDDWDLWFDGHNVAENVWQDTKLPNVELEFHRFSWSHHISLPGSTLFPVGIARSRDQFHKVIILIQTSTLILLPILDSRSDFNVLVKVHLKNLLPLEVDLVLN